MVVGGDAHSLVVTKVHGTSFFVQLMEVASDAASRAAASPQLGVLTYARVMVEVVGVKLRVATSQLSLPPSSV